MVEKGKSGGEWPPAPEGEEVSKLEGNVGESGKRRSDIDGGRAGLEGVEVVAMEGAIGRSSGECADCGSGRAETASGARGESGSGRANGAMDRIGQVRKQRLPNVILQKQQVSNKKRKNEAGKRMG